ncbi:MAG: isopentenyl-diphosphate Delta-isomerase [Flavobacteriaceae bacterium]|nr:isopentenyl-diphosphate Delta-isomerase [Flavobacteriaceae bacterium]
MIEKVILVNEKDEQIGLMEKMEAHEKGLLHRAFSVFVFNKKGELMLQQRAKDKYHSPLEWTNTCCSHQRDGETSLEAGKRRLMEEMGFTCELRELFSFIYKSPFSNGLTEHEYDHVLIGEYDENPNLNSEEVENYKWKTIEWIKNDMKVNRGDYTSWFLIIFDKYYSSIG